MVTEIVRFRFTTDEYEQMIAAGILTEEDRVELIEGEIIEMSPIGDDHVFALNSLAELFFQNLEGRAIISIQNPIRLSDRSRPQPDIALWRRKSRRSLPGPGDILLLVEISDTTLNFDRNVKLPLYAQAGISEVWIVDLVDERIDAYREPLDDVYNLFESYHAGGRISPLAFPDVALAVDDIFEVN